MAQEFVATAQHLQKIHPHPYYPTPSSPPRFHSLPADQTQVTSWK